MSSDQVPEMESVHRPGGSPDTVALAILYAEGRRGAGAAVLLEHAAGCPGCSRVLDALAAVDADLADLPASVMPASVSERIEAALAAAGSATGTAASGTAAPGMAPVRPASVGAAAGAPKHAAVTHIGSARRGHRLRVLGAVAAGVVVFGGGSYLLLTDTGSTVGSGSSSAGLPGNADTLAEGGGGIPSYDRQSLERAIGSLLAQADAAAGASGQVEPRTAGPESRPSYPGVDPQCLTSIPMPANGALSVTRISYEGRDAVVVLFATDDPGRVQVTVVSADCSATATPQVLDEFAAPR